MGALKKSTGSLPTPPGFSILRKASLLLSLASAGFLVYTTQHQLFPSSSNPSLRFWRNQNAGSLQGTARPMSNLVVNFGYPLQKIVVQTDDGYLLDTYRIPSGRDTREQGDVTPAKRQVVLLWHGLLDSSATWVLNGPERSLGFILADAGFDVWMGNSRGNMYSRGHATLGPNSQEYWDFSFDEMAKFDLPATIQAILSRTGAEQIAYVGHSQGTAMGFIQFSQDAMLAGRVSIAIMLAPVVLVTHMSSPILKYLAQFSTVDLLYSLGTKEFMPGLPGLGSRFFGWLCDKIPMACTNMYMAIVGYNHGNLDESHWDAYMAYTPAGSSAKDVVHWAQAVRNTNPTDCFAFDYGTKCRHLWGTTKKCNQDIYGTPKPAQYHFQDFGASVALVWGGMDLLSNATDVEELIGVLPPEAIKHKQYIPQYEHLDFTWGIDVHLLVYPNIVKWITESKAIEK